MPRPNRRQLPKSARLRGRPTRGSHIGQPDPPDRVQLQSIARRYARTDRQARPLHCHTQDKLMYDTREIAVATGQALQRVKHEPEYVYHCPTGNHWHLTTSGYGEPV